MSVKSIIDRLPVIHPDPSINLANNTLKNHASEVEAIIGRHFPEASSQEQEIIIKNACITLDMLVKRVTHGFISSKLEDIISLVKDRVAYQPNDPENITPLVEGE